MYVYLGKKGQDREEEDGRRDEERIKNFQRDNQIDLEQNVLHLHKNPAK